MPILYNFFMHALLLLTLALPFTAALTQAQTRAQTPGTGPAPIEIVTAEQNLWTTMAEGDFATVRKLFTPDFIQVDSHIAALDTLLITLKQCKLTTYELRDLQVRILSPDSAMTAYHVVNTFDCGTDKPELHNFDNNSTTIWVRRPGTPAATWLVQAHTETPAKP